MKGNASSLGRLGNRLTNGLPACLRKTRCLGRVEQCVDCDVVQAELAGVHGMLTHLGAAGSNKAVSSFQHLADLK